MKRQICPVLRPRCGGAICKTVAADGSSTMHTDPTHCKERGCGLRPSWWKRLLARFHG